MVQSSHHGKPIAVAEADARRDLLGADLREVLESFEQHGELRAVEGADWHLELGAITEMMALRDVPALLFDKIKGYPPGYRAVTNLLNSPRRVGLLLGHPGLAGVELVRAIKSRFVGVKPIEPVEVG